MTIIKFEMKKFCLNLKNLLVIAIGLACITMICFSEIKKLDIERKELIAADSFTYMHLTSDISIIDRSDFELVQNFEVAIHSLDEKINYANKNQWRKSLEQENTFLDSIEKILDSYSADYLRKYSLDTRNLNDYFLNNNIKPDNSLYGVSANYFVRKVCTLIFSLYGFLFFLLLFYDLFSSEKENNHLPFLKTFPINYQKILLAKIFTAIVILFFLLTSILLATFFIGFILSRNIGYFDYPIFNVTLDSNFVKLPFSIYFVYAGLSFLILNYLMLIILNAIHKTTIKSEKVLVTIGVLITFISIFSQSITFNNYYLSLVNFVNLHQEIEWLFLNNYFENYKITILILVLFEVFFSFVISYKRRIYKRRV